MTLTAVILLLVAACTHAGWNFISKKQHPTLAFYFLANIFGMFCISPLISYYWDKIPLIPPIVWMFLLMSGFFLAAIAISGYTIVDDEALRRLRELPGKPFDPVNATLVYLVLEAVSSSLWQGAFVACSAFERQSFAVVLRTYKSSAALTGIGIFLTYGLVLASMSYVTNVSYVAAFRQLSILIVAVLGMVLLKEPHHVPKVIGIILIFAGLVMVGIF